MKRPIVIFAGYFARYPLGGHVLAELSCLIGLQKLGFDVYFVEETGQAPHAFYDLETEEMTDNPQNGIAAMLKDLERFGLEKNWCLVDSANQTHGISREQLAELCRESAFLFSRAGTTWLEEFYLCKKRIYLDVDPGFTQFRMSPTPIPSRPGFASPYDFHHHFTFATRIGYPDCPIPLRGLNWKPTYPPFVADIIPQNTEPAGDFYTTIMSWNAYGEATYNGEVYGQKNREFSKIEKLPLRTGIKMQVAMASAPREVVNNLTNYGWEMALPTEVTRDLKSYLHYIVQSRGEVSIAKHGYVKSRSGWVSDRSIAFLASARPVVVQDTGISELIPTEKSFLTFRTEEEALERMNSIESNYELHSAHARTFAEEHFGCKKVLAKLLSESDVALP